MKILTCNFVASVFGGFLLEGILLHYKQRSVVIYSYMLTKQNDNMLKHQGTLVVSPIIAKQLCNKTYVLYDRYIPFQRLNGLEYLKSVKFNAGIKSERTAMQYPDTIFAI